jgi:uncharacterized protein (TIGR03086 family)
MSAQVLKQAFASTAAVLWKVSPDQMTAPTPCYSWSVHDLVNHIVGGPDYFAETAETGVAPPRGDSPDFAVGDFAAVFDEGAEHAVAAFSAEGVMEKSLKLPFADLPGAVFVFIAAIDTFTHGWDLAKATGQSTDLDPPLAVQLLEVARASLPESLRGPDRKAPFGPEVEVAEPACPADALAAFMGRQP